MGVYLPVRLLLGSEKTELCSCNEGSFLLSFCVMCNVSQVPERQRVIPNSVGIKLESC